MLKQKSFGPRDILYKASTLVQTSIQTVCVLSQIFGKSIYVHWDVCISNILIQLLYYGEILWVLARRGLVGTTRSRDRSWDTRDGRWLSSDRLPRCARCQTGHRRIPLHAISPCQGKFFWCIAFASDDPHEGIATSAPPEVKYKALQELLQKNGPPRWYWGSWGIASVAFSYDSERNLILSPEVFGCKDRTLPYIVAQIMQINQCIFSRHENTKHSNTQQWNLWDSDSSHRMGSISCQPPTM